MSALLGIFDTITVRYVGSDGSTVTGNSTENGTTRLAIDSSFPASTTNQSVSIAWVVANTQALVMLSTKDMTVKTNSSGSPANTISLKAGIPLIWRASPGYYSNPFTVDVTSFFVTTTAANRLQVAVLTT
jgi:hypothetical protein